MNFIEKAQKIHGYKYDYSKVEYVNSNTKVCIICPEHGEFWMRPHNHLKGQVCPKCAYIERSNKKRLSTDDFIKKLKKIYGDKYDYTKVKYVDSRTKITLICKKHGEFTKLPGDLLKGKACKKCNKNGRKNRIKTRDEFEYESRKVHGNKYDYSKVVYARSKSKVCIICPEHGEFWQTPNNHLNGCGCPKCSGSVKRDYKSFIDKAKKIHGDKYDYSKVEYRNSKTKVCIICPEHGEFWQTPSEHFNNRGCPECKKKTLNNKLRMPLDEFINRSEQMHKYKYDYSKVYKNYINSMTKVCIICPEHGEFWQTPHHHINGVGCPVCGANMISEEKLFQCIHDKFHDAIHGYKPSFLGRQSLDIYIPSINVAVEYQGRQHFEPISRFGGEKEFSLCVERDIRKKKLCSDNGLSLIYFTYERRYPKEYIGELFISENKLLKRLNNYKANG